MAGDLGQNYTDFWQTDNSLDHSVMRKNVISVEVKLNINVQKI